jgi:hypothetical protein
MRLYVQHESYGTAVKLLHKYHFCIIAGQPGIGKTTLAETLIVDHLGQGCEVVSLSRDIRDAFTAYVPGKKQLFVYDDFLGTTSVEAALHKNEDASLVRLLDMVAHSPNARLILTTRELILNRAKQTHEKLASANIDVARCTITVNSYTPLQRAEILHNHVWFSPLSWEYKSALLQARGYRRILEHKNYIPRIVEWMTAPSVAEKVKPSEYVSRFLAYLDHPHDLWRNAFEEQLSERARHLLCVTATLPPVLLSRLEIAYDAYRSDICREYGIPRGALDLRHALKELEQAFLSLEPVRLTVGDQAKADTAVKVHHPSVADFLEAQLRTMPREAARLARTAVGFGQVARLWSVMHADVSAPPQEDFIAAAFEAAERLWDAEPLGFSVDYFPEATRRQAGGSAPVVVRSNPSIETRLLKLHEMVTKAPRPGAIRLLNDKLSFYCDRLKSGFRPDSDLARQLLEAWQEQPVSKTLPMSELRNEIRRVLLEDSILREDLELLALLSRQAPEEFSSVDRERLLAAVASLVGLIETDAGYKDIEELESITGTLLEIEEQLGVSVEDAVSSLDEKASEIKEERAKYEDDAYESHREAALESHAEEQLIDSMFDVFSEELPERAEDDGPDHER